MLTFIGDQILQFWPPYRMEHTEDAEPADESSELPVGNDHPAIERKLRQARD